LPGGDLDRIKRQQYFLSAAFSKVLSGGTLLNPFKLHSLLGAVSSSLLTDPALNIVSLARQFQNLSSGNMTFATIPNEGSQVIYPDGVETAIVRVDTAAMAGFVNHLQGKPADAALASAQAAAPSSVSLDVLNGTTITGLAGRNGDALRAAGFRVDTVDSTDPTADTTVEYPDGAQAGAKAVAAAVPGASLVKTGSVHKVTLVLGANGVQANALRAGQSAQSSQPAQSSQSPQPAEHAAAPPSGQPDCIN
jgi:hypothetical protein